MTGRRVAKEIERAKYGILAEPARTLVDAGILATHHNITDSTISFCIEDDEQRERAAELLRADDWQVITTELYGRPSIVLL